MNTRIQVEHPITEQVIDYDLIREQILVAWVYQFQVKIICHNYMQSNVVNAEDPYNDFRPSPGKNHNLTYAWWTWCSFRYTRLFRIYNSTNYDSMIAN
jgi:acetyl-CoA carboxylase biotin carboxylase subunit